MPSRHRPLFLLLWQLSMEFCDSGNYYLSCHLVLVCAKNWGYSNFLFHNLKPHETYLPLMSVLDSHFPTIELADGPKSKVREEGMDPVGTHS